MKSTKSVLLIYTGGTIGMLAGQSSDALIPVEFNDLDKYIPELSLLDCTIEHIALNRPKDSSNIESPDWMALQQLIIDKKDAYFGFVVLHGTDTMSYAASMASFLLLNLKKPVIYWLTVTHWHLANRRQREFDHGGRNCFYRAQRGPPSSGGGHLF